MAKKSKALQSQQDVPFFGTSLINPVRAGLNVDLTINQRFMGKGAPVTSFGNKVVDDLESDIFWTLYLWKFGLKQVPPEDREANRALLEWLMNDPNFQQIRGTYINHQISAAATSYELTQKLLDMQGVGEGLNGMGQAENMEDQADDLDKKADKQERGQNQPDEDDEDSEGDPEDNDDEEQDGEGGGSGSDDEESEGDDDQDGNGSGDSDDEDEQDEDSQGENQKPKPRQTPQQMRDQAEKLRNQAQQKRQQAQKQLEQALGGQFNTMMRANAANQANEFGQEVQDFLSYWGFEEGDGIELDIQEIRRLMQMLGEKSISQLSSYLGRVRDVALSVLRGRSQLQVMIDSVGITDDIFDLFPEEQALLSSAVSPEMRQYYIRKFIEDGGMMGFTKTSEAKSEGAFICGVDESGSMNGYVSGEETTRNIIAKALALGLARAAAMNQQQFYMIGFGSYNQITDIVTEHSQPSELLRWGTHQFGGGTEFNGALNVMMDIFDNMEEKDKQSADLLMITDGQADVDDRTFFRVHDAFEKYGVRLHVLLIGNDSMNTLEGMAQTVIQFDRIDNIAATLASAFYLT